MHLGSNSVDRETIWKGKAWLYTKSNQRHTTCRLGACETDVVRRAIKKGVAIYQNHQGSAKEFLYGVDLCASAVDLCGYGVDLDEVLGGSGVDLFLGVDFLLAEQNCWRIPKTRVSRFLPFYPLISTFQDLPCI